MANAEMKFVGEIHGVRYYMADEKFDHPGIYYWDEGRQKNVRIQPTEPSPAVDSISDGDISQIAMDELGKWPSFEAQSWACKVTRAVLRVLYRVNPFDQLVKNKGPWSADETADHRAVIRSDDNRQSVVLHVDGDFGSHAERQVYAENIAQQLNGKLDTSVEAFLRELTQWAPKEGHVVGPTALMGVGIKARLLLGRLKKEA